MKKSLSVIFAALLTVSALTGCASPESPGQRNSSSEQNNAAVQSSEAAISQPTVQSSKPVVSQPAMSTNASSIQTVSSNASAAYKKLIAYKTEDYGQQSIADFNASLALTPDELTEFLAAQADVISSISSDDENYDFFTTTMSFSAQELYCEHMGEELAFFIAISKQSGLCDYLDEDGEPVYEFNGFVEANVVYSINAPKLVSVAERDKALLTFKEEMQNYLNGLSETKITKGNIRAALTDKAAELANRLSTENMQLSSCDIYLIEISDAGGIVIQ